MTGPTQYGFAWGPVEVTRVAHIEDRGYVIEVRTDHRSMQVIVSEKGRKITAFPSLPVSDPRSGGER